VTNFRARAKSDDFRTSHAAAHSLKGRKVGETAVTCLRQIAKRYPEGMTCSEVCRATGIVWQTVSPRWADLRAYELIEISYQLVPVMKRGQAVMITTEITRPGDSGREQIVWYATRKGLAWVGILGITSPTQQNGASNEANNPDSGTPCQPSLCTGADRIAQDQ
jgi:hypothetical protein